MKSEHDMLESLELVDHFDFVWLTQGAWASDECGVET